MRYYLIIEEEGLTTAVWGKWEQKGETGVLLLKSQEPYNTCVPMGQYQKKLHTQLNTMHLNFESDFNKGGFQQKTTELQLVELRLKQGYL